MRSANKSYIQDHHPISFTNNTVLHGPIRPLHTSSWPPSILLRERGQYAAKRTIITQKKQPERVPQMKCHVPSCLQSCRATLTSLVASKSRFGSLGARSRGSKKRGQTSRAGFCCHSPRCHVRRTCEGEQMRCGYVLAWCGAGYYGMGM